MRSIILVVVALTGFVLGGCTRNSLGPSPDNQPLSVTPIDPQIGVNSGMAVEVSSGSANLQSVVLEGQVGVQRLTQSPTTSLWFLSGQAPGRFLVEFRDNSQTGRVSGTVHDKAFVRFVPNEALPPGASQPCGGTYRVGQDIIFWIDAVLGPGRTRGQVFLRLVYDLQGGTRPSYGGNGMGGPNQFTGPRFRTGIMVGGPVRITDVVAVLEGDGGYTDVLTQVSYPCQIDMEP